MAPQEATQVLDVGYQDLQYQAADNFLEEHYPWPASITALGIEEPTNFSARYPEVDVVTYDGKDFPFDDGTFDVVWSNAVLEHVGGRDQQRQFLREADRVGAKLFLTTPNRGFPIEVHSRLPLLHWLPKPVFDRILRLFGLERFAGDYMSLLRYGDLEQLLLEAGVDDFQIVRNKIFGLTLDFIVIQA
jgi:SAM-dependent methyltransferase